MMGWGERVGWGWEWEGWGGVGCRVGGGKGNHGPVQWMMGWDAITHGCPTGQWCRTGPGGGDEGHCGSRGGTRAPRGAQGRGGGVMQDGRDWGGREGLGHPEVLRWHPRTLKWGRGWGGDGSNNSHFRGNCSTLRARPGAQRGDRPLAPGPPRGLPPTSPPPGGGVQQGTEGSARIPNIPPPPLPPKPQ